jgi:hypothetical protein
MPPVTAMTSHRPLRLLPVLRAAVVVIGLSLQATTDAADVIPTNSSPITVRGGVMAVPVRLPPEGEGLPSRVTISILDGDGVTEVLGRVIYLATPFDLPSPRWTRSANATVIRAADDDADPRRMLAEGSSRRLRSIDAALVLADLPDTSANATLRLGNAPLSPTWIEPGPDPLSPDSDEDGGFGVDPELVAGWRDDRPDPQSPFEWFRWTLIAPARRERLPAPPGDAASQLFARHVAELWLAGIARVERQSKGVADSVRDWLTATVRWSDGEGPNPGDAVAARSASSGAAAEPIPELAMWIADPAELGALLGILLDQTRDDSAIMSATLAWMDARTPVALWVESDRAGRATIIVANPLIEELVVTMQWLGETLPPLASLIPFRTIDRVRVDRPAERLSGPDSPEPVVLALEAGSTSKRLAFAPRAVRAKPPLLSFGSFVAALTLPDVQAGRLGPVPPAWTTTATLRRRDGHWEIFAECLAPSDGTPSGAADDTLTIVVRNRSLTVRRDGTFEGDADALADIGVRNYADRWRARIVLPDAWMPLPGTVGAVVAIGMRRETPAVVTTAVLPQASFARDTPLVEIDVSEWQEGTTSVRPGR